jgi:type IV pilus assembly protein PilC
MPGFRKVLGVSFLGFAFAVVLVCSAFMLGMGPAGVLAILVLLAIYCWVLIAYFQYRYGRQEEFLHLLKTAAELEAPLAPTLWAYLRDRPQGPEREFWVASLLFFVLPGYYWLWHRQHTFDHKIAHIALQLDMGVPLSHALRVNPGVATAETSLAAAVGQATGKLSLCLKRAASGRRSTAWLEIIPRLVVYPLALLIVLASVLTFWMTFIMPKFQRIFSDFRMPLPPATQRIAAIPDAVEEYIYVIGAAVAGVIALVVLLCFNSTVRWFCPGIGYLYRMSARSRVLKSLGILLEAEKPVPEALAILLDSEEFPAEVRRRLRSARARAEQGEGLADSLYRAGLLPRTMAPLVRAAERARNLPWALTELGDHLSLRAARLLQRTYMVLAPTIVVAIGTVIGFLVVGMFIPLIKLIDGVAAQ